MPKSMPLRNKLRYQIDTFKKSFKQDLPVIKNAVKTLLKGGSPVTPPKNRRKGR